MKKWILLLAAAATLLSGGRGEDISKLEAVKVIEMSWHDGQILLRTDTGAMGSGENLDHALRNMIATATGDLFLETTEYLLIKPECTELLDQLWEVLRPSCVICLLEGQGDLTSVGAYLDSRQLENTLMDWRAGNHQLPTLQIQEERMNIVF